MDIMQALTGLTKALEAGNYSGAPASRVQGSALQVEDLDSVMHNVTFGDKQLMLQQMLKVESCKSTTPEFVRQLSVGQFGGAAQVEGAVGQDETSDYVRLQVPMCFYSHVRRVTIAANLVATVDGMKAEDRAAEDAALKIAADVEFDLFRGKGDYQNAGVFDGNLLSIPLAVPNIMGLEVQIRNSDAMSNTQDLMFAEYGSAQSVVIPGGGTLSQSMVEDASVRSAQNHGDADKLVVDLLVLSAYNKIAYGKERIILAGSPQDASGADLRRQWVSGGTAQIKGSRFLAGKTNPARARVNSPTAPTFALTAQAGSTTLNGTYTYYVTAGNEFGESAAAAAASETLTATQQMRVRITPAGSGPPSRFFNVYRSPAGGSAATAKWIGRIANSGAGTTDFMDLGNKLPGFVTGYLLQDNAASVKELAPYSRLKLAVSDLSQPEAHFRFLCLAVYQPRKFALIDNLTN